MLPLAAGDGMPVYRYVPEGVDTGMLYGTTFESRQLASVELLNSTHQRIDLFLSIFTLQPGENLTVLIPFREIPVEVDVKESTDREFLDDIGYDDIVQAHKEQHYSTAGKRFGRRTGTAITNAAISTAFTPLGLGARYYMEKFKMDRGGSGSGWGIETGDSAGEDEYSSNREVEKIAHYDFEGVSITVYSVSANATLDDFLSVVDMGTLPDVTREVVEEYREQYVAVIESIPSAPIDPVDYTWLLENAPNTTARLIDRIRSLDKIGKNSIRGLAYDYAWEAFSEYVDSGGNVSEWFVEEWGYNPEHANYTIQEWYRDKYRWRYMWYGTPLDLSRIMEDLFHSIYGFTDFKGNILSVTTSLNDGVMYFPLGTSKGWENPIRDTRVIYITNDEISLEVTPRPKYDAFVEGRHYYVLEFMNDNPDSDTTSKISKTSRFSKFSSSFWTFIYNNTAWLAITISILFQIVLWFLFLRVSTGWQRYRDRKKHGAKGGEDGKRRKVLTIRHAIMAILNITISAPVTFILMGWRTTETGGKEERNFYLFAYLPLVLVDVVIFIMEVMG